MWAYNYKQTKNKIFKSKPLTKLLVTAGVILISCAGAISVAACGSKTSNGTDTTKEYQKWENTYSGSFNNELQSVSSSFKISDWSKAKTSAQNYFDSLARDDLTKALRSDSNSFLKNNLYVKAVTIANFPSKQYGSETNIDVKIGTKDKSDSAKLLKKSDFKLSVYIASDNDYFDWNSNLVNLFIKQVKKDAQNFTNWSQGYTFETDFCPNIQLTWITNELKKLIPASDTKLRNFFTGDGAWQNYLPNQNNIKGWEYNNPETPIPNQHKLVKGDKFLISFNFNYGDKNDQIAPVSFNKILFKIGQPETNAQN